MPPNVVEPNFSPDPEVSVASKSQPEAGPQVGINYKLYIFKSTSNLIAHILIGVVVGVAVMFSLSNGMPMGATSIHVLLCVIGYQLLMAESILSLHSENGWSSKLRLVDKRRAHWILQILGSGMALSGSLVKILDKTVHWNTYHGQLALVAMVFNVASLINGLASLYAYEWRRVFNGTISKLTHICFGIVAFGASSVSLCFGFDKLFFRTWAGPTFTDALIAFTSIFTFIVIVNPFITFFTKASNAIRK